ncbi:hypothetical protein L211DRAFT_845772 [Terfezia boudieri ATCC MYA-4762]|uniref:Uncharacterized protein n=1 Tax=Terfezia boudieri ATCC MYA-4762 TaxID=1051890 RepID=A0A3N4LXX9_9PEZI|nr:hypothetical protein L211DRAFT_845772 [Terfezia boudieri ATCC MYA-4762]
MSFSDTQMDLFWPREVPISPPGNRAVDLFPYSPLGLCPSQNKANMASPSPEDEETLGIYIDPNLHCPPNIKELIEKHQVYDNNLIVEALDSLTPMKQQLYPAQKPKYSPDTYHMWKQVLSDARQTYNNAFSGVLYVREYLSITECEFNARQRQWKAIKTREKAQTIMLTWLDREVNELGNLLTRYSCGCAGPRKNQNEKESSFLVFGLLIGLVLEF